MTKLTLLALCLALIGPMAPLDAAADQPTKVRRGEPIDIGFASLFGVSVLDNFSTTSSVTWKLQGLFLWKKAGIAPYLLLDKGRIYDLENPDRPSNQYSGQVDDRYFVQTGVQFIYRFLDEAIVQPYLSVGVGASWLVGEGPSQVGWGVSGGVGLLIPVHDYVFIQLDIFAHANLSREGGDTEFAANLGDVILVNNLGIAVLF